MTASELANMGVLMSEQFSHHKANYATVWFSAYLAIFTLVQSFHDNSGCFLSL